MEWAIVALLLALFSYLSYQKKSLNREGVLLADAIGLTVFYFGDWSAFSALVAFFVLGELATRWARTVSNNREHGVRGIGNIVGNAGIGLIAIWVGQPVAFFASLSAALSDTLSSEIGMLSEEQPRLITTGEKTFRGTDGAVTPLGFGAAIAGALFMASIHWLFYQSTASFSIILVTGFIGSVADSVLGATLQQKGWLDNNGVNWVATAIAALLAIALWGY